MNRWACTHCDITVDLLPGFDATAINKGRPHQFVPWAPARPDGWNGEFEPSWFVRRWRENPTLINLASVALLAIGVAQVTIGIILISRG